MNKKYGPLYVKGTIAAASYQGQDKPIENIDVWNILVTSDKMSDKMAYDIVKTLWEKKPELVAVHKEAREHRPQVSEDRLAAAVPPRRQEVFRGAGREVLMAAAMRRSQRVSVPRPVVIDDARLAQGRGLHRGGGGRRQPPSRLARPRDDDAPRRHVAVPPVRGGRRSCPRRCCGRCMSASCCCSSSCCFRSRSGIATASCGGTSSARCSASRPSPISSRAATTSGTATRCPTPSDVFFGVAFVAAGARSLPAHVGLDHAVRDLRRSSPTHSSARGCPARGSIAATTSPACRVSCTRRSRASSAPRSTFRRRSSSCSRSTARFCSSRAPASSSSTGASPRWAAAHRRRPHGRARVVPAGRPFGLGCGDDGDHRLGRLSDARARGLRQGCGRRPARRGRTGRHHLAARAGRGRVPDRRVPARSAISTCC